ncbi:MAG: DNA polymerase I [Chlamydiae bacterium]|nr:DNA polymerase I [Chlamydiota bacterium]
MKELYIIDASGFLFRAYYAIRNMTNAEGESTNALFGFIRSMQKLINDFHPEHMVAVFDGPNNWQSRLDIYPDYKANRREAPPDLSHQMVWAREFCPLMGIPLLDVPNVEADDTMGSVALWAAEQGAKVYLCSSDKDLCQFVNDNISMLHAHKDNKILGPAEVKEAFGVKPHQIRDYLAIVGDTSDNVPGVPGLGPKAAESLLGEYGSLEEILQHAGELSGKRKETLTDNVDLARMSLELVTIDTNIEFPHSSQFFTLDPPILPELKTFYQQKNFRNLLKDVESLQAPADEGDLEYVTVDDEAALNNLVKTLSETKEICFDTETTDIHPITAKLVGIGFCIEPKKAWYIPCNGRLGTEKVIATLKPLFENPKIGFYAHNAKYDIHVLKNYEVDTANLCFDTILASYVLNAHERKHSLDILALERFGKVKTPITDLIGKGKKEISMWDVPIPQASEYCCEDVDYTLRLKKQLEKELEERKLTSIFYDIELPLVKVLAKIERKGMFLDIPYLKELGVEVRQKIASSREAIFADVGEEFNLNSPKQLSQILFEKLEIPPVKKTATGYSTNAEVLEKLRHDYPIVNHILDYRQLEKLRSTYIDNLPRQVNPETHRIHCNFNQTGTATGRLASQDPNLQNIPVRTELGRKIRHAFRPDTPDTSYLSVDYSQIELRLMAHFSEDPALIEAFQNNQDIHQHTASRIFEVFPEQVTPEMRRRAKAVNFGIMYGQGAHGLSQQLGISRREAKDFIAKYFELYAGVQGFVEDCIEKCQETGKAVTMTGRERAIPEITNKNPMLRSAAERLAVNTPLQGSQADLIKIAMIQIDQLLTERGYPQMMILQIHDELLFEIPDHLADEVSSAVKKTMEEVWELKVPLIVNIKVGKNWEQC